MTQQVRGAYRNHRKRTWAIGLMLAVAIAAVMIPIASGAPDKPYTLQFSPTENLNTKALCNGDTYSVDLRLANRAKSQTLGSAELTFPSFVSVTGATIESTNGSTDRSLTRSGNVIRLDDLVLPSKTGVAVVRVTFDVTATRTATAIGSVVKQSNNFNDSSGTANLFDLDELPPKLSSTNCTASISGTVWNDRNENGVPNDKTFEPRQDWDVYLYRKISTGYEPPVVATADTDGVYTFSGVVLNREYVVCEQAPTGTSWVQTTPASSTPAGWGTPAKCAAEGHEDGGWSLNFTANVTGANFGNVRTVTLSCEVGGGDASTTGYDIQLGNEGDGTCTENKPSRDYKIESWTEGTQTTFVLAPATGSPAICTANTTCVLIGEKLTTSFTPDPSDTTPQANLFYDDKVGAGVREMPYCEFDPRAPGEETKIAPNGGRFETVLDYANAALPSGHTSCIIEAGQAAGSLSADGKISLVYYVFSSVDGFRFNG